MTRSDAETNGTGEEAHDSEPGPSSGILPTFNHHNHNLTDGVHPEGESGRTGFDPVQFCKILWRSSSQVSSFVNVLWPFVPAAIILNYAFPKLGVWIFAVSYVGMIPAANLIGFAGQELARKMPKAAGILIETALGSIVEIVLFMILIKEHSAEEGAAEHGNLIPVIQAAILGSILTNLLLCLGLCFFVGGLRQKAQSFHAAVSEVGTGLLLVASFGLLIPSAFYSALKAGASHSTRYPEEKLRHDTIKISQLSSIILIIAFLM